MGQILETALGATGILLAVWGFGKLRAAMRESVMPASKRPERAADSQAEGFATASAVLAENRCIPPEKRPGVEMFRAYVIRRWGGTDLGIWRECSRPGQSEHKIGNAWDWGIKVPSEASGALLQWLEAKDWEWARRLGIGIVIANRAIWSSWRTKEGWRPYKGEDPHTTHIHISFTAEGGMGKTTGYERLAQELKEMVVS